ncbi:hypothetical protein [Devosia sp.]|uniref:hypothetical protein n=1 Tax=Devosia sp. TaxID=1871048 RepID=UPI003BAC37C5
MHRVYFAVLAFAAMSSLSSAAEVTCDGPLAPDSNEAALIAAYGADNVVTGNVDGPEGTTMLATTLFPNDPQKKFQVVWWDEATRSRISYFSVPADATAPGGVRRGMTIAEVEAINGEPFTLYGFWWDYGGAAGFQTGKLADLPGGCFLNVTFQPSKDLPAGVDPAPISGDQEISSSEPMLAQVEAKVEDLSLGYPDFSGTED